MGGLYGVEIPETGYSGDSVQKEEKDRVKDILKDAVFYGTIALALIVLAYRFI